jgi:hypothetical protein
MEPTITRLDNERLALGRDNMTIFIDSEGEPTQTYAPTWTDMPITMGSSSELFIVCADDVCSVSVQHSPYIIAVLPKCVEIRTIEPKLLIQNVELAKPRFVCCGR